MIHVLKVFFKNDGDSEKDSKRGLGDEVLRKGKFLGTDTLNAERISREIPGIGVSKVWLHSAQCSVSSAITIIKAEVSTRSKLLDHFLSLLLLPRHPSSSLFFSEPFSHFKYRAMVAPWTSRKVTT